MARVWYVTAAFGTAAGLYLLNGAARAQEGGAVLLPEVVVAASPVPGTPGIAANKVPAFVTTVPARDFEERRSPSGGRHDHVPRAGRHRHQRRRLRHLA